MEFPARSSSSLRYLALGALLALPALRALAVDYYLGSSAAQQGGVAVSDIAALNALKLKAGDRVFFEGGESFSGNIVLDEGDAGTAAKPIELTSFGTGRATIRAGNGTAIKIYNTAGISISRLDLVGADKTISTGNGIDAGVYLPNSTKLSYLRFDQMRISGFRTGVEIWAWYSGSTAAWPGFSDVALSDLEVFDNLSEGIKTWGTWRSNGDGTKYSHADFYIGHCVVYGNKGNPASTTHTGSGIFLAGVDRGLIEYCVARDNGGFGPTTGGGPFGIWAWEANEVTIQHNLVYNQKASSPLDGGAYDLDGGASNCIVQYNYSYNNDGPAIGIIQFSGASPLVNNVVRYNISENDSRRGTMGVIYVGEFSDTYGIDGADIYGNTYFIAATASGKKPAAVSVQNHKDIANVRLRNNLFHATHNGALITGVINNPAKALYQGNNYWGGTFDLATFRAGGQELLAGVPVGSRVDPQLRNPGKGGAVTDPTKLALISAYELQSSSPVLFAGLDLKTLFGRDPGPRDFYERPVLPGALSVGAAVAASAPAPAPEPEPLPPPSSTPAPSPEPLPAPTEIAIDDRFDGTGLLHNRLPDTVATNGARWIVYSGNITTSAGLATTNNTLRTAIESGVADGTVETIVHLGAGSTGLLLRSSDSQNFFRLALTTTAVTLSRNEAGVATTIASGKGDFPAGRTYRLTAVLAGASITVSVDGVVVVTAVTTFNQTATRHGLFANNSGVRSWDAFTVASGTPPSVEAPTSSDAEAPSSPEAVVAPSTGEIAIDDTFSGVGLLQNRVPDVATTGGAKWSVLTGNITTSEGLATTNNTMRAAIETGLADGTVEAAVRLDTGSTGLLLRASDSSNYLRLALSTTALTLSKTEAGVTSAVGTANGNFVLGRTYLVRAVLAGSSLTLSVDGVVLTTVQVPFNRTATRHGLFANNSGVRGWDRFTVIR